MKHSRYGYILALCLVITCLSCNTARGADKVTGTIGTINIAGLSYNKQLAVYALEGIVNRISPNLMVNTSNLFWSWPNADLRLEQALISLGLTVKSIPTLEDAVHHFSGKVRGVVVYDPAIDAERYVACTLAGLKDALPVTSSMLHGDIAALPVLDNLVGRWRTNGQVYKWAITHLLPKCSHSICYSAGVSYPGCNVGGDKSVTVGFDYAFYRRAFMFNLSPNGKPAYGYPAYPSQAATFATILHALPPLTEVYGWAEPEPQYCRLISREGDSIVCSAAPNLSLYAAIGKKWPWLAKLENENRPVPKTRLRDRYYVDFETNEADTPKIAASWQMGAWFNSDRGKVPITWGLTATLANDAPALLAMYHRMRARTDSFFSGVSGGGYCLLNLLPNLVQYASHTKVLLQQAHEHVTDVWETPGNFRPDLLEEYVKYSGVEGISHFPVPGRVGVYYLNDGTPVILPAQSLFYYGTNSPQQLAQLIRNTAKGLPRPGFIECYGGLSQDAPTLYYETMQALGKNYVAVSLRDMVHLARSASGLSISNCPRIFQMNREQHTTITVRNCTRHKCTYSLQVKLPSGWLLEPHTWLAATLKPFEIRRIELKLMPSAKAVSGNFEVTDSRRQLSSIRRVHVGRPIWRPIIDAVKAWHAWRSDAAVFHFHRAGLFVACPSTLPYAAVEVRLPFAPSPKEELKITVKNAVGAWSAKLEPPGGGPDIMLIPDNSGQGTYYSTLPAANLRYPKGTWHLRLFAIGNNAHFEVTSVEILKVQ